MEPPREQGPLPRSVAWRSVGRCLGASALLLGHRAVGWPRQHVGLRIHFADGTSGQVYRETTVAGPTVEPCVLVVAFRLRWVRGRGHAWFRAESLLNTPLFVGFPGFVSKLWLTHDERGRYRGLYEWDGVAGAEHYARSLWRVLALVSEPGSIGYRVAPGVRRDQVVGGSPGTAYDDGSRSWWRVVGVS